MIRAICFDVGGTLVYRQGKTFANQVAELVGIPISECRARLIKHFYLSNIDDLEQSMRSFCRDINVLYNNDWIEHFFNYANKVNVFKDVYQGLQEVRDYRLCLLSNCTPFEVTQWEDFGLDRLFEFEVRSYEIGICKPDSRIFRYVGEKLEVHSEEIVMVGDSCYHDVQGAKHAGWKAIHLIRRNQNLLPCYEADDYSATLTGIGELVHRLNSATG